MELGVELYRPWGPRDIIRVRKTCENRMDAKVLAQTLDFTLLVKPLETFG